MFRKLALLPSSGENAYLLDFVHSLYFNTITTFRKLDLLPSSGKKEGQKS
jgi:hypothetical protein